MTNLEELKQKRPPRREVVDAHKRRMVAEARQWKLQELRKQVDLSQERIADELDISQARVSKIERGDIDRTQVETLRRYAAALGGELRVSIDLGDSSYQLT